MRSLSRRTVLTAAGAAALASAFYKPQIAFAAHPSASGAEATSALLDNIVAGLAGTTKTNAAASVQPKLTAMYDTATKNLGSLVATPTTELFTGLALGSDDGNLESTYEKLFDIAVAITMPIPAGADVPTDLSGSADATQKVITGLRWLYDNYFSDQDAGYYGNWYNWEIGIPTHVGRTLALLHGDIAEVDAELPGQYIEAMDLYLRNGIDGDVDLDSRFHTGANLADITTNRIVQGAITGDDARVTKAIADQLTVYEIVDPYNLQHGVTDGFYPDGSFIQHASVAYTGSYGIGLLERVTTTLSLLDGTEYTTEPDLESRINEWLATSFSPVIVEGWMMEMIKGRAVSRTTTGYTNASKVAESIVALSRHATADSAAELSAYIVYLHGLSHMSITASSFAEPANIVRYTTTVSDDTIVGKNLVPDAATFAYNAMDRHVHHRPEFTFALARSSKRVSKYEYMSGENLRPWFQGEGSHYLYLAGDDQTQAYGVDYVTVVDPMRLAGTTAPVEERKSIPELYGKPFYDNEDAGFTSSSVKQNTYVYFPLGTNDFSGGATLGSYAVAGMQQSDDAAYTAKQAGELPEDFVVYANARSSKSWFMLDNEIVVLVSGISDEHDRDTVTTIDSRISSPGDDVSVVGETRDGAPVTGAENVNGLSWLRYANATRGTSLGYVFYTDSTIDVRLKAVEQSRRFIRTSNTDTLVSKTVFDVSHTRAAKADAGSLAYAIVPGAEAGSLASYEGPEVVQHTDDVHAVRHSGLGLLAATTFAEGEHDIGALAVDGRACVIAQNAPKGRTVIAVSDPTFARDIVSVTVPGRRAILDESHPNVTAHVERGRTRLDISTHEAYGATISVTIRGRGIV
ncbi:polysaccharide lyase family 8 super-sandwich domain-containing protein [Paramicrobacterium fandaimingii]|uniref:polysaccharide lyase family 8 super-sandwich domain-containing protein n=1 Tax=Paramicrobacterium fandaimingii TaxID=2708079 RepID=UPI00141FF91B|nr:polysaccharide lyase family 8 super-sandwich domain-containing protein [Microbacterium fandaimingii]